MIIFKRKIKFILASCPECGGHLELDATLETAYYQYCGATCIINNARKRRKKTSLDKVIGFIERQLDLKRKDRIEVRNKKDEEKRKDEEELKKAEEWLKKYWLIFLVIPLFCIIISIISNLLGV